MEATDPLYILYTSGTTGQPKGIVRDNGGHAVALTWSMGAVFDAHPGEVYWAASDIGWVVGHSYIVYGPLLQGCTTVLYEGKPVGPPTPGRSGGSCADHGVNVMFTAPTAIRAIKRVDPGPADGRAATTCPACARCSWRASAATPTPCLGGAAPRQAGDRPLVADRDGLADRRQLPGHRALPVKPGSPARAVPGYDVRVLDEAGDDVPAGEIGAICLRLPLPPGCTPTLWNGRDRWIATYLAPYPGLLPDRRRRLHRRRRLPVRDEPHRRCHQHRGPPALDRGDGGGALGAIPTSPSAPWSASADSLKGQVPVGFVVLKAGVDRPDEELAAELVARIRDEIGPGRVVQGGPRGAGPPEDALRQGAAGHDPPHGRRRGVAHARRRSRTRRCSTTSARS